MAADKINGVCLAIDFGAGSGRVIAGSRCSGQEMELTELHRFVNRQVRLGDSLYWDFPALFSEMLEGIRCAAARGMHILSVAIDTWGVDFGLITLAGRLLSNPLCYRDSHTEGLPEAIWSDADALRTHYAESGIYPLSINTLYQLVALNRREPAMMEAAGKLLFMPDLFAFFLTGSATCERTIASTSELLTTDGEWNLPLIDRLGLPRHLFGELVDSGTLKGYIDRNILRSLGIGYDIPVIAAGCHDTACAVYASSANSTGEPHAFISSGTWSLFGQEIPSPVTSTEAYSSGYTNERAVGGTIRILQNIPGMWILQQLVKKWTANGSFTGYDDLIVAAERAEIDSLIDVDDASFVNPHDMEEAISLYCRDHAMTEPATEGEYAAVALRSLALRYHKAINGLNDILSPAQRPKAINIVGGGSRNAYLNRLTAQATGLPVVAGPVEATALGSIALQIETLTRLNLIP